MARFQSLLNHTEFSGAQTRAQNFAGILNYFSYFLSRLAFVPEGRRFKSCPRNQIYPTKSDTTNHAPRNRGIFIDFSRQIRDNCPPNLSWHLSQKMPRRRSHASPAKAGRTWWPVTGLTVTEGGHFQVQARVRRTGRAGQTKTFECGGWGMPKRGGIGMLDGSNRNTFVDRREETRNTLASVLERCNGCSPNSKLAGLR
jgi:hypothetical protein